MKKAIDHLLRSDPVLSAIIHRVGDYAIQFREPDFETLVKSIVYQQLSGRVASVIFGRLAAAVDGKLTPASVLKLRPSRMRKLGLSTQKTAYIRDLARHARDGVRRRGAEEAGAIFVKVNRLDGTAELFGPAPQSVFEAARPADRLFNRCLPQQETSEAKVEERLARELRFDPDVWIIEVEDRAGRHFLDQVVA
jgi:hypothetical protein